MEAYQEFLKSKLPVAELAGVEPPGPAHASLKPHQVDIARWAMRGGRRAVFANFGLGKTRMHLQVAAWVVEVLRREQAVGLKRKYLIVAPLGVRQEFTQQDGPAMGLRVDYVRTAAEAEAAEADILITNYERVRDGDLDPQLFAGAGLDESSVLRSFGSLTYQTFLDKFAGMRFRYCFTATPSPNSHKELIHYGGFLGIMDTGEALTRFFQRDSSQAGHLTLYPHMEDQFWMWLRTWAVFLQSPADMGYDATGYDLPPMAVHWHRIEVDHTANWTQEGKHFDGWGQGQMFMDAAQGLEKSAAVKRDSVQMRRLRAQEIMAQAGPHADGKPRHWLLWHDLEVERAEIERHVPGAVTVWGSQELEEREDRILAFSRGESALLATKPRIAGSGCNFQRYCSDAIFMGVGYKFNDFIQAVHRIFRFLQERTVNIHIVYLDTEDRIVEQLKQKWRQHEDLMRIMQGLMRKHGLAGAGPGDVLRKSLGVDRKVVNGL